MSKNKWIPVCDHVADTMPQEDCEVWVTRAGFGEVWVQKIDYYVSNKRFDWDGVIAWMPLQDEEPQPYPTVYPNRNQKERD